MTENQGSVRLICSLSLASCRLKAEALVRLLHNKLWSLGVFSTGGMKNGNEDCDKLIKENILYSKPVNIIDKPPKSQIYGANDVNAPHWKQTMHTDEEEELYNTPNCSSPPSPAEEEILINPPVFLTLPGGHTLSSEQCSALGRDPGTSQTLNDTVEYSSTFCKLGGITLKEKELLYEKLQKYASGSCPCIDEGVETFYDADSDNKEHSSLRSKEDQAFVNGIFRNCTTRCEDTKCSFHDNVPIESNHQCPNQIQETVQTEIITCFKDDSFSKIKNENNNQVIKNSITSLNIDLKEGCEIEKVPECGVTSGNYEHSCVEQSLVDEEISETKDELPALECEPDPVAVIEDPNSIEGKNFSDTSRLPQQKSDHQEIQPESEPEEVQNCLKDTDKDDRPVLIRSTSLKTGKTPPGTPRRKKIVRFADALGLDLEAVRHIVMDDLPVVPPSAFNDLRIPENDKILSGTDTDTTSDWDSSSGASSMSSHSSCRSHSTLSPLFQQPSADPNFLNRVRTQKVCLENVLVSDRMVHCVVRVLNISYEKVVSCRYSINGWATHNDVLASYVPGTCDGFSDKFSFNIFLPHLSDGQKLIFAVRYLCCGQEYWDNNCGNNYSLCYNSNVSILSSPEDGPSWLHHFI